MRYPFSVPANGQVSINIDYCPEVLAFSAFTADGLTIEVKNQRESIVTSGFPIDSSFPLPVPLAAAWHTILRPIFLGTGQDSSTPITVTITNTTGAPLSGNMFAVSDNVGENSFRYSSVSIQPGATLTFQQFSYITIPEGDQDSLIEVRHDVRLDNPISETTTTRGELFPLGLLGGLSSSMAFPTEPVAIIDNTTQKYRSVVVINRDTVPFNLYVCSIV